MKILTLYALCAMLTACATGGTHEQNRDSDIQRLRAVQAYLCAANPYNCPGRAPATTTVCAPSYQGTVVCTTR